MSGRERNHLFLNVEGRAFEDLSLLSGADDPADGRSFAVLDYDRDGWLDLAVANANAPLFQLFRNQLGTPSSDPNGTSMLALRFVGGNHTSVADPKLSARDGFGAVVEIISGERRIVREHRAGEGFAAQNSSTLLVGLGDAERADGLIVRWPSGQTQTLDAVDAGSLLTVFEVAAHSPNGTGYRIEPYSVSAPKPTPPRPDTASNGAESDASTKLFRRVGKSTSEPSLRVFTTMATWCAACLRELPLSRQLQETFTEADVAFFGIPTDPADDAEKLASWHDEHRPPYRLLTDVSEDERKAIKKLAVARLGHGDVLPTSFVTDQSGQVLFSTFGIPTVSDLRRLAR